MPQNLDIVIVDDNDKCYRLPTGTWMDPRNKIPPQFAGDARVLVRRGALTAEVPKPNFPSGYYCVLINFSEVEGVTPVPVQSNDGSKQKAAEIGVQGLVIHVPQQDDGASGEGAYYVVAQDVWQKLTVDGKTVSESVSLAKAGALCGVTTEGFLLNLNLIGS
jgi:hypothetical protein